MLAGNFRSACVIEWEQGVPCKPNCQKYVFCSECCVYEYADRHLDLTLTEQ